MSRKIRNLPTQARLKELFEYDATTGVFTWRVSRGTAKAGAIAGSVHCTGYVYIRVDGVDYKAHRLAWVYHYGQPPEDLLDHINRDKADNRINNLREATHAQNQQNKKTYTNNLSGIKGVSWYPLRNKWRVRIQHNKQSILVGFFDELVQAERARKCAEKQLHTHANNF